MNFFSKSRVGNSELFSIDINLVKQLMSSLEGKVIYPKDEKKEEIFVQATEVVEVKKGIIPEGLYTFKKKINGNLHLVEATLKVESGKLFIEVGSRLAPITKITNKGWIKIRESVKMDNYIIQERIECKSPSMAAAIVCGHNKNGWKSWKNSNGDYIDIYRKKEEQNGD